MSLRLSILAAAMLFAGGIATAYGERSQPVSAKAPQRVVSVNLCTDQIVIALADRRQIAGLSRNAADPEMSAIAREVRGLRIVRSPAEELAEIDPDLVAGLPPPGVGIGARDYPRLDLVTPQTYPQIEEAVRQAASALGHPERGNALIARMRADLAQIPRNGGGKVAAFYQRRGFLTGTGTLVDDLMARAGLVNLATRLGKPPLSRVSLEELIAANPDYLIVESEGERVTDQGTEMLHHPALAGIPRIAIPQSWTVCGGPAYVQAARSIADQIAARRR